MSIDSSSNKDQYTKRTSTFVVPTKRIKKPCISKSSCDSTNSRSPIFLDLDDPLTDSATAKQLYDTESQGDDEVIDMTESKCRSLGARENTPANAKNTLLDNNIIGDDSDTHIIDLTTFAHGNITTATNTLSPRLIDEPTLTTPTYDFTDSTAYDLIPLGMFKERRAASPPQIDMTPNTTNGSNKASRQKRKANKTTTIITNKKKATTQANQQLHSRPINTVCHQAPDYESLTLVELRNAVKKYGFKIKDRQSMIGILENIQTSTSTNSPSLPSQPPSMPAPSASSSSSSQEPSASTDDLTVKYLRKQEFASRVKSDIQLWERILRYENVDVKTCSEGLSQKEKGAYYEYLDENAAIYKPPPKKRK